MQRARGSEGGHLTKAEGLAGYGCSSLEEEPSNAMSRLGEGVCGGVQGERPAPRHRSGNKCPVWELVSCQCCQEYEKSKEEARTREPNL